MTHAERTAQRSEALEALLDDIGNPEEMLDMLSTIFSEKARHVLEAWQDDARAKMWDKWSNKLADFSTRMGQRVGNPYA